MAFDLTQRAFEKLRDPEPEPNWRSMFADLQDRHQKLKIKLYGIITAHDNFIEEVYQQSHDDGLDHMILDHITQIKKMKEADG